MTQHITPFFHAVMCAGYIMHGIEGNTLMMVWDAFWIIVMTKAWIKEKKEYVAN